jgi:hypothetical protein
MIKFTIFPLIAKTRENSGSHRIRFMHAKNEIACQYICLQIHSNKNFNPICSASDPT